MFDDFVTFARELYQTDEFIPLHAPSFSDKEKEFVCDAIDTTFVSSVSEYVDRFERLLCDFTGTNYAVSLMNGTAAIHLALHVLGTDKDCEVITQSLTFVATCNAITYTGATPVFVDVERDTLGMCPDALLNFLNNHGEKTQNGARNRRTGKKLAACLPMHTFGHPVRIKEIIDICQSWGIDVIEEAAEAIGSRYRDKHCGTFANIGALSFNGNKIVTSGGGGAILTDDESLYRRIKHLSTTAKKSHSWEYAHDEIGFNYRMPGINAALGCGQMMQLENKLADKRQIALAYEKWAQDFGVNFIKEPRDTCSNYWLNAFELPDRKTRDDFLKYTNEAGVMTRPIWRPMHLLPQFADCAHGPLHTTTALYETIVNVPSSPRVQPGTATQ